MIQAAELRIGNYYMANGNVFLLDLKMMWAFTGGTAPYSLESVSGIPITRRLLEVFKAEFAPFKVRIGKMVFYYDFDINDNANLSDPSNCQAIHIRALHLLQQRYFSETGEELLISL